LIRAPFKSFWDTARSRPPLGISTSAVNNWPRSKVPEIYCAFPPPNSPRSKRVAAVGRCVHPDTAAPPPQPSPWEIADVFRLYGESYRHAQPVSAAQAKVMEAIMACRTAHLGGTPSSVRSAASNATPTTRVATGTVPSVRPSRRRTGWQPGGRNSCRPPTFTRCLPSHTPSIR